MVSVGKNVTCTVLQPRDTREAERHQRGRERERIAMGQDGQIYEERSKDESLWEESGPNTLSSWQEKLPDERGCTKPAYVAHMTEESEVSGQERKHYHQWTRCSPQGYNQNVCYNRPPTRRKTECGQHGSVSLLRPRFPVNLCWLCNPRQSDLYNPPRAVSAAITMSQNILNKLPMRQGHLLSATLREIISWGLGGRAHIAAVRFSRRVVCYQQKIFIAVHETQFPRLRL